MLVAPVFILILAGVVRSFPTTARAIFLWHSNTDADGEWFTDGVDDLEGRTETTWPRATLRAVAVFPNAQITGLVWPVGYMDLRLAASDLPI